MVKNSLHHLGLTIDTDLALSPQPRHHDIALHSILPPDKFHAYASKLAHRQALHVGNFASPCGTQMISKQQAQQVGLLSEKGRLPSWWTGLRLKLCQDERSLLLK